MLKNMPQRLYQWEGGWVDLESVAFINRVVSRNCTDGTKYYIFQVSLKNISMSKDDPSFWSDPYASEQVANRVMDDFVQAWANYLSSKINVTKTNEIAIDPKTPESTLSSLEP